jgi:hypothetical protein
MKFAACPIVLLLSVLLAPPAAAAECGEPTHPKISVQIDESPVREDRTLSLTELSKMPSASRRAGMEAYDRTLGLTEADIGAKADIDLVTVGDGSGVYCTTARSALITLEWTTVVHIAAQIAPGSCFDRVVSTHEQKHVGIDKQLIPIARQVIEIALTSVIRRSIPGKTIEESQRNLQDQARARVNQAIDIFSIVRTRKQLALDSKEEYDRVPKSCGILEYLRLMRADQNKAGT